MRKYFFLTVLLCFVGCSHRSPLDNTRWVDPELPCWVEVPGYNAPPLPDGSYGVVDEDGDEKYTGRVITMHLRNQLLPEVIYWIFQIGGLNYIIDANIECSVNGELIDVPWDLVLDYTLRSCNLRTIQEGNLIRIMTEERFLSEREPLREAQTTHDDMRVIETHFITINHADVLKAAELASKVLTTGGMGWVQADPRTSRIVVHDTVGSLLRIRRLLKKFDIPNESKGVQEGN